MVNSRVSKQWLFERYAMNAASVHGEGAVLARISRRLGFFGQKGPSAFGNSTLGDCTCESSVDMAPSSSASQSVQVVMGDLVECAESIDNDDDFLAIITCPQKLPFRLPSALALRFWRWMLETLSCWRS